MAIAKSKQKTVAFDTQLEEDKKDIVLKVNTRDQEKFSNHKTLETLDTEV